MQLEDAALREKIGTAGRKRAGKFTLDGMIDATLAAYAEVLDARS